MNLVDMTLQNSPSDMTVSTSRVTTLNPEATVYHPVVHKNTNESTSTYMNGDVCHDPCGKKVPTATADNHTSGMMDLDNDIKPSEQDAGPQKEPSSEVTQTEAKVNTLASDENNGSEKASDETNEPEAASEEPLSPEKIKALLSEQVALFFSRENWSSDPYLISQMDSDQYVPVFILAGCLQFSSITKNQMLVLETLRESEFVQLDEEKGRVRPNYKRCIVILREIPSSTPSEEIEALFDHKDCPKVISCEFINNGSWYITFDNDDDAQKAYSFLRETVKVFKDKPILARIKTKPISRQGCFSVLPSKSGNGASKLPNGPIPAPAGGMQPPTPSMGAVPNMTGSPGSAPYNRLYLPGSQYYGYPQMPAVFYPNPTIPWTPPNVYDIHTFLNYNGLTPKGTFKPTGKKGRNKKDDKESGRHMSGGSNASTSNRSGQPTAPDSPHPPGESSDGNLDAHIFHSQNDMQNLTGDPLYTTYTATGTSLVKADMAPTQGENDHLLDSIMVHGNAPVMSKGSLEMPSSTVANMPMQSGYAQSHLVANVPSYHPSQRNGYMGRGGRHKRLSRQESESVTSAQSHRNGYQRALGPSAMERAYHDRRKPQFDLQASAFPPLPGADGNQEAGKKSPSSESDKKFSDIMKGTPKLKPQDKEDHPVTAAVESSKPQTPNTVPSSSHADIPQPSAAPISVDTTNPAQVSSNAKASDSIPAKQPRADKKQLKNGSKDSGANGRPNRREHRQVSNKENRPTESSRSWREKKDEDGWITKGAREPKVPTSEPNHSKDNKVMVNGDQTVAPPPTKNEVTEGNDKPAKSAAPAEAKALNCVAPQQSSPEANCKPSWANMARSGKSEMERLSAELKEKDELEKHKKQKTVSKGVQSKTMPVTKDKPFKPAHASEKAESKPTLNAWTKRSKTPPK